MRIVIKLKNTLNERGIKQNELAKMTNLREATISEFVNAGRRVINKDYLTVIAEALQIKDTRELIDFEE